MPLFLSELRQFGSQQELGSWLPAGYWTDAEGRLEQELANPTFWTIHQKIDNAFCQSREPYWWTKRSYVNGQGSEVGLRAAFHRWVLHSWQWNSVEKVPFSQPDEVPGGFLRALPLTGAPANVWVQGATSPITHEVPVALGFMLLKTLGREKGGTLLRNKFKWLEG